MFCAVLSCFSLVCSLWPMDYSLPESSVHGILQEGIVEWLAMLSSRGFSQPRGRTCFSWIPCIVGPLGHLESPTFLILVFIWWAFSLKTSILTPCSNSESCSFIIFPQILLLLILNLISLKFLTSVLQILSWEMSWYCRATFRKYQCIVQNYLYSGFIFSFFLPIPLSFINWLQGHLFETVAEGWESGQCRETIKHGWEFKSFAPTI